MTLNDQQMCARATGFMDIKRPDLKLSDCFGCCSHKVPMMNDFLISPFWSAVDNMRLTGELLGIMLDAGLGGTSAT